MKGSHITAEEDLNCFAKKNLNTATRMDKIYSVHLQTFDSTYHVPQFFTLTVAYYTFKNPNYPDLTFSQLPETPKWFENDNLPEAIFDVKEIIDRVLKKLKEEVHELILIKKPDTRNFRKKIMRMGLLNDTQKKLVNAAHRLARLFSFRHEYL